MLNVSLVLNRIYSELDCPAGEKCLGSERLTAVRDIASRYLSRFSLCAQELNADNRYSCAGKDGGSWRCFLTIERPKEEGRNPDFVKFEFVTEALVENKWQKTDSIWCDSFANCSGEITALTREGRARYRSWDCSETYRLPEHEIEHEDCDLPLFEKFLKKDMKVCDISMTSRYCSFAQLILGAAGVLYFGVKCYREIQQIKQETSNKLLSKEQMGKNDTARKWSRIYGTASLASLLLAVYSWRADFRNIYYNRVNYSQPFRFC